MTSFPDDRRDLAAMFVPLARALVAREEPALHAHGITMWGYVVLTALAEPPVRTQAALAQATSADKSRIIGVLDDLQERGLIQRQPDTADRRVHLLSVTPAGDRLRRSVEAAIRASEQDVYLAAMFVPLARALVAREEPALHAHDISMWGYVVLTALAEQPVRTQAALAQAIGADKSRIIGVLDDLQERGLIQRQPDTADRRVHLLSLTPAGDRLRRSVEAAIRNSEQDVLAVLPPADREAFLRSLKALYERYRAP